MSVAGSDITDDMGEGGTPGVTMGFRSLIGHMRLPSFKGDPTELQEWILSIQKKQVIYGLSDQEMVLLAYEAAAGPVSKFIGGLYRENPALTWAELKSALVRQYASERTAIEAVRKLFRLRQGDSESIEDLGERITGLATLAFPELATRDSGSIQALLADAYMDALGDKELRCDVLRKGPSTLAAAVEAARNNERLLDRIRGSMARGTNITKNRGQFRARGPREEKGGELGTRGGSKQTGMGPAAWIL